MKSIPIDVLHSAVCYSSLTGEFTLSKAYGKRKAGTSTGSINKVNGYVELSICGQKAYGHRVAWACFYGVNPIEAIDHINGNRSDNRISNLRLDLAGTNAHNLRGPKSSNTSGFLGVTFCKWTKRWRAQITVNGKNIKVGRYETPELAYAAYVHAKRNLHVGCTL